MRGVRGVGGGVTALGVVLVLAQLLLLMSVHCEAAILADDIDSEATTDTTDVLMVGGYYRTSGSTTVTLRSFAEYDTDEDTWSNLDGSAVLSTGSIQAISLLQAPGPFALMPQSRQGGKDMSWGGERRWARAAHMDARSPAGGASAAAAAAAAVPGVEAIVVGGAFNFLNTSLSATDFGNVALYNYTTEQWEPLGEGCNGVVTSVAVMNIDTSQGNVTSSSTTLIVAGKFTECKQAGGTATVSYSSRVGYYNLGTKSWYNVAVQPANKTLPAFSTVTSLALSAEQDFLYLVGRDVEDDETATFYACSTPITATNGQLSSVTWTVMAETAFSMGGSIDALGASHHKCYIGGSFNVLYDSSGLVPMAVDNLAVFDSFSSVLSPVEGGSPNGRVASISVLPSNVTDTVFVGGPFTQIGNVPANSIAVSVNSTWRALGSGLLDQLLPVRHLQITALANGNAVVGGVFDRAGPITVWNTAYWDEAQQQWDSLGNDTTFEYYRMYPFALARDGNVYMTGQTILLDIVSPIFEGVNYDHSLVDNLMARFDGNQWQDIRLNEFLIDGLILSVEQTDNNCLVVGGAFRKAGDLENVNNLALYNYTSGVWSDIGGGVHGLVFSTSSTTETIIVGGTFQYAGEQFVSNVAIYDKNSGTWSALGEGITSAPSNNRLLSVNALVPSTTTDNLLYVGGNFYVDALDEDTGTNVTVSGLVAWNSSQQRWQVVQKEITDGQVIALVPSGNGGLYVGGNFTLINQQNSTEILYNLALLDTTVPYTGFSSWIHVPPPCNVVYSECSVQSIHAVAVFPGTVTETNGASQLYIGGTFQNIDGNLMNNVAQLSATGEWLSLGSSGVTDSAMALVLSLAFTYDLSTLYVAGVFTNAGSVGVNDIVGYDLSTNTFQQLAAVGGWSGFIVDLELLNGGVYDLGDIADDSDYSSVSPGPTDPTGLDKLTLLLVGIVAVLLLVILIAALSVLFFNKYGSEDDRARRAAASGSDLTEEERATWDDYLSFEWEVEYNLLEISGAPLGRGPRSVVHRANYKGQDVAVKIFHAKYNGYYTRDNMCRFISVMRSLRHPSIVHIVGACQDPLSIVMEYATMGSVADVMRISPHKLTWRIIKKLSLEAARGMAFLHGQVPPVLHYNFTASNLLISHNWAARVSDVGITQTLHEELNGATTDTRYAAPEVLRRENYTEKADVFSFGVVMWEMAMLEQAFSKEEHSLSDNRGTPVTMAEVRSSGAKLRPLPMAGETAHPGEMVSLLEEEEVREWPKAFTVLVARCLLEDPRQRPSFNEVLSALNRCPDVVVE